MSNLLKLKEWLTVPDAARHLSSVFGEKVSEADVLRLALDGKLKLSVYFVNHAYAQCGKIVPIEEAKTSVFPDPLNKGESIEMISGLQVRDGEILELDEEVISLKGVWDLPMIGAERLDVEHEYQNLTDGPAVSLMCLDGSLVESPDGRLFRLKEHFRNNEFFKKENLKEPFNHPDNYYPAGGLPTDSVLVVRVSALEGFEQELGAAPRTGQRDEELQKAANNIAESWRSAGRKKITKREIAKELSCSDEWCEWTYQRIERIIRVQW